jgi:hypothetical protein
MPAQVIQIVEAVEKVLKAGRAVGSDLNIDI